ncbi:MAG: hypothetical protein M3O22_05885 [Pseudomonadota bacterium]|nr:hypothetical protein [Pseudomonadota bacterium]
MQGKLSGIIAAAVMVSACGKAGQETDRNTVADFIAWSCDRDSMTVMESQDIRYSGGFGRAVLALSVWPSRPRHSLAPPPPADPEEREIWACTHVHGPDADHVVFVLVLDPAGPEGVDASSFTTTALTPNIRTGIGTGNSGPHSSVRIYDRPDIPQALMRLWKPEEPAPDVPASSPREIPPGAAQP